MAWAQFANVDDFGAAGDGRTFDEMAIQAAINAVGPHGTIKFTAGKTYNVCGALKPLFSQTFIGHGATLRRCDGLYTTLLKDAPQSSTEIVVADSSMYRVGMQITPYRGNATADGESHARHTILEINDNKLRFSQELSQGYLAGHGVANEFSIFEVEDAHLTIEGLIFDGNRARNDEYISWTRNKAIHSRDGLTVRDAVFYEMPSEAISVYGTNSLVERNVIFDTNGGGIHLGNNGRGHDVTIQHNILVSTNQEYERLHHAAGMITVSLGNDAIRVIGNVAASSQVPFISIIHKDMGDWTIAGNQIFDLPRMFFGRGNSKHEDTPMENMRWLQNYAERVGTSKLLR